MVVFQADFEDVNGLQSGLCRETMLPSTRPWSSGPQHHLDSPPGWTNGPAPRPPPQRPAERGVGQAAERQYGGKDKSHLLSTHRVPDAECFASGDSVPLPATPRDKKAPRHRISPAARPRANRLSVSLCASVSSSAKWS